MARKFSQVLAVALLSALLAVPLASASTRPSGPTKPELRALRLRGLGLDRIYHIGPYAPGPSKLELRALRLRGLGLDRIYHLGPYARATGSSFHWGDAAIGSGATFGASLLALAAVVAVSRRRTPRVA